ANAECVLATEPTRPDGNGRAANATGENRGRAIRERCLKFALVNPNWNFKGSTYFGCPDAHVPLELLFAHDQVLASGHEALVVDAQTENLSLEESKCRIDAFGPDFLVIPTAPSYLFWRCPPPELRVP